MYKTSLLISLFISLFFSTLMEAQTKTVLLEEFSSTPCGSCPPQSQVLKEWHDESPNHIVITHHSRSNDNMSNQSPGLDLGDDYQVYAQPTVFLNRIRFMDTPGTLSQSINDDLFIKIDDELNVPPIALIDFEELVWDSVSRTITGTIAVDFEMDYDGYVNIGLYIIEDNVTGGTGPPSMQYGDPNATNFTGISAYDQKVYDAGWVAQNFPNLPYSDDLLTGYPHFNVVRAAPLGTYGQINVISNDPQGGDEFELDFSYDLPAYYDPTPLGEAVDDSQVKLVAFLVQDTAFLLERNILNSTIVDLPEPMVTSTEDINKFSDLFFVHPNPCQDNCALMLKLPSNTAYRYSIITSSGQRIFESDLLHSKHETELEAINTDKLTSGMYIISVQIDNKIYSKHLIKY